MSSLTVLAAAAVAAWILAPPHAGALERPTPHRVPASLGPNDDWTATSTCQVFYYNVCSIWMWGWSFYDRTTTFGVVFDNCSPTAQLSGVWIYEAGPDLPAGYGYTGIISVSPVDEHDAPARPAIQQRPYLQMNRWAFFDLPAAVPSRFVVTVEYDGVVGSGHFPVSDWTNCVLHASPHSFYYGTASEPLSPGSPLMGAPGRYSELFWRASMIEATPVAPSTWGAIKSLYR